MVSVYDAALLDACHASAGVAVTKAPFGGVAIWNAPGAAKAARDSAAKAATSIAAAATRWRNDMRARMLRGTGHRDCNSTANACAGPFRKRTGRQERQLR